MSKDTYIQRGWAICPRSKSFNLGEKMTAREITITWPAHSSFYSPSIPHLDIRVTFLGCSSKRRGQQKSQSWSHLRFLNSFWLLLITLLDLMLILLVTLTFWLKYHFLPGFQAHFSVTLPDSFQPETSISMTSTHFPDSGPCLRFCLMICLCFLTLIYAAIIINSAFATQDEVWESLTWKWKKKSP